MAPLTREERETADIRWLGKVAGSHLAAGAVGVVGVMLLWLGHYALRDTIMQSIC